MKRLKNLLLVVVALSVMCGAVSGILGCNNCEHINKKMVTNTATCEAGGIATYHCDDCKKTFNEDSEALGHDYSNLVSDSATCTQAGTKTYSCSRCNSKNKISSSAKGHSYSKAKCKDCGAISPSYQKVTVTYSSGEYRYYKTFSYLIGYTIYELSCSVEINSASKTAEFAISGNLRMFTGEMFFPYICDDNNIQVGSGGIMLSPANNYIASRNITLSREIRDNEICYIYISAPSENRLS